MSRRQTTSWCVAALMALGVSAAPSQACGPFFPNRLLQGGDETVLWAPVGDFAREIARLTPPGDPHCPAVVPADHDWYGVAAARQTATADADELRAVLAAGGLSSERQAALVSAHAAVRDVLRAHAEARTRERWVPPPPPPPPLDAVRIPDELPAEFELYLRGAVAYHAGRLDEARAAWRAVLDLPPDQRRHRTTWAAYMLGRALHVDEPDAAVGWYRRVRDEARAGFTDRIGLAAASLGWEAQVELRGGALERAVALYLEQAATGDPGAVPSLRTVVCNVLSGDAALLNRAARDENLRRVVTAHLLAVSGRSSDETEPSSAATRWLAAIESADVVDVTGADRLAWLAYQAGAYDAAERWLRRAPDNSAMAHWIRAKLLLRAGRVEHAMAELAAAARGFPPDEEWRGLHEVAPDYPSGVLAPRDRTLGELGVLRLARGQYIESLDTLLRAGYWMDAAYVAERVLSVDELRSYVDRSWPVDSVSAVADDGDATGPQLRHVLARRLARAARWDEARPYFAPGLHRYLDEYVTALRRGRDATQPEDERAAALLRAARLCRDQGLALLGTELDPDWSVEDGDFELPSTAAYRDEPAAGRLTDATANERTRLQLHALRPARRWHYRYIAADLAWDAAELMPDEDEATARVLCEAGGWLKARDPGAAEPFYRALVRRCGTTDIGREAARLRWFPQSW
jgi:tetratricopeptide (TPR) repeat protein